MNLQRLFLVGLERVGRTICALLIFSGATRILQAQEIAPIADPGGISCNISAPPFVPTPFYILAKTAPYPGLIEARFRITGLPADLYKTSVDANPTALVGGDPFGDGCNFYFTSCLAPPVHLFTITVTNQGDAIGNRIIRIERHTMPANPMYSCPLLVVCDPPEYSVVCVSGGSAFLNGADECEIAVDHVTWSKVKALYE